MELKTYTSDESDRYLAAAGILGEVVACCAELSYNTTDEEIKAAILEFERPYAIWRHSLEIADEASVNRVYTEVKPLIKNNKITIDYILQHTHHGIAVAV